MEIPAANSVTDLRVLYNKIEAHLRTLEALGQDISQDIFVAMVISKLPQNCVIQLEMLKGKGKWKLQTLREQLQNYIRVREEAERSSSKKVERKVSQPQETTTKQYSNTTTKHYNKIPLKSTAEALVASDKTVKGEIKCIFCSGSHWNDECKNYTTLEARKERVKGRCFICLSKKHSLRDCPVDKPCYHCNRKRNHNRSLCPQKFATGPENSNLAQENFSTESGTLMASEEMVLMQMAKVTIKTQINSCVN